MIDPAAQKAQPAAMIRPALTRPDSRCATAAKMGTMSGPGATPRPVRSAE